MRNLEIFSITNYTVDSTIPNSVDLAKLLTENIYEDLPVLLKTCTL